MIENIAINVLIIDDEAPARKKLQKYIENDSRFCVLGQAKNGQEALTKIAQLQPDLLLLDIQMPGMTGFDVLRLMDNTSPAIIFATAYDEYAVQAFEVSAIDYLLKPISQKRLQQALDKVANSHQVNSTSVKAAQVSEPKINWDEKVDKVLANLKAKGYVKKLAVRQLKRISLLPTDEISYIVSEHRLINVYDTQGERFWTNENLTQLEARLNPEHFMRIHRGAIINLSAKFEIESWDSGRLKLHFSNNKELIASREHVSKIREYFEF